ncbi:hypothetical protein ACFLSE_09790 [Bacteroidota bacterium]
MKTKKTNTIKGIYNYKIIKEKKLIIEAFTGDITLDFFKESMLKEFNDPEYLNLKFGICDLRSANLILSDKEIKELFEYALVHDKNLSIKWATLTKGPYETAMAMIYELQAVKHYGYKIFSTLDAAASYLNIKLSENDLSFVSISK